MTKGMNNHKRDIFISDIKLDNYFLLCKNDNEDNESMF